MMRNYRRKLFFTLTLSVILMTIAVSLAHAEEATTRKVLVISDVDDTIKISYVRDKFEMVSFSAYSDSLYYGMNTVYQNLKKQTGARFFYVSNGWTPTVEEVHTRLIDIFQFPEGQYLSRGNPFNKDFKFETISALIEKESPTEIILVGDNGEKDSITYHRLQRAFENLGIKFHVFIHKVYDRPQVEVAEASHSKSGLFPEQSEYLNSAELSDQLLKIGLNTEAANTALVKDVRDRVMEQKPNSVFGPLVSPYYQSHKAVEASISCRKAQTAKTKTDRMLDQIRQRMAKVSPQGGN